MGLENSCYGFRRETFGFRVVSFKNSSNIGREVLMKKHVLGAMLWSCQF
jgi:hypothetical protein